MFCTVASDHTIGSFTIKTDGRPTVELTALEKLAGIEALCVAWSPKGKQIVVGCKNGNLVQLKPDLKVARTIAGPCPVVGGVIALLWLSNYQFCATYQDPNDRSIKVLIVDAPKGEPKGIFTCYDDITYGMPELESNQNWSRYYLDYVAEWSLIIAASSSSSDVAVLGSHDNGTTWEQWQLVDSGRAQLPLIRTTESYPVGMAIDRSSNEKLALGPETTLPNPVPILHIFGTAGQLIGFHMVYLAPNAPALCTPPTESVTAVQQLPHVQQAPQVQSVQQYQQTPQVQQVQQFQQAPQVQQVQQFQQAPQAQQVLQLQQPPQVQQMQQFQPSPQAPQVQKFQQFPQVQQVQQFQQSPQVQQVQQLQQAPQVQQKQHFQQDPQLQPANRQSLLPSEISFTLNTGATSTPRPKQSEVPMERPKILPSANLFNETMKPQANSPQQNLQQQLPPTQQQVELKIPDPRHEKLEPTPVKPSAEKQALDEALCMRAYTEEQILFDKELRAKLEPQVWECGTAEEQRKLIEQSTTIEEFLRDLRETTNSLSSDMAYLKALLLQSFAWLEETKSKNSANSSDNPRDRSDRNKIKELQRLFFYTQSQLIQATKALDMEWVEYESRERSKIKMPSLEFIYQSLTRQAEIIAKEKTVLEQLTKKWKNLTRGSKTSSGLNKSMSKLSLSSSLSSTNKNMDGGAIDLRCKAIAANTCNFTVDKQLRLREYLLETKTRIVKAINPSPVQDRLEETLSSLASQTPVRNVPKSKPARLSMEKVVSAEQSISKNPQQSPLASLNNIVSKYGTSNSIEALLKNKPQGKAFSISSLTNTPPVFGPTSTQVDKKPVATSPIQTKPKSTPAFNQPSFTSLMPSTPRSQAFSNVQSISFGTTEQKTQEQPPLSMDSLSKGLKLTKPKDNSSSNSFSFFQDPGTKVAPAPSTGNESSSIEKNTAFAPANFSISEGISIAEVSQEPPASQFTSFTTMKAPLNVKSPSTETSGLTTNMQSFSFASKPMDPPAFSFASKDSATSGQTPAQAPPELPGLFDFDLPSIGGRQPFGKLSMPTSVLNFGEVSTATTTIAPTTTTTTIQSTQRSEVSSVPASSANVFASSSAGASGVPFDSGSTMSGSTMRIPNVANIFGVSAAATGMNSSLFGGITSAATTGQGSAFGGALTISASSPSQTPVASTTASIFGSSVSSPVTTLAKPTAEVAPPAPFGKSSINFATPAFGGMQGSSPLNFGNVSTATASPPAFDKPPQTPPPAFRVPALSPTAPDAAKTPTNNATSGLFGSSTGAASNTSMFGNVGVTPAPSIFGGGSNAPTPSAFGGNSGTIAPFGSQTSATIFGGGAGTPAASIFGTGVASPMSAFGNAGAQPGTVTAQGSPQAAPAFGQSPAFGSKSVFGGQTSVFGSAKPEFSNPFGVSTFGAAPAGKQFIEGILYSGSRFLGHCSRFYRN